jgi:hypothetical protein
MTYRGESNPSAAYREGGWQSLLCADRAAGHLDLAERLFFILLAAASLQELSALATPNEPNAIVYITKSRWVILLNWGCTMQKGIV